MDPLSDSSASSSDDEERSGVTALADLLWHKVVGQSKNQNARQPSPSKSSSRMSKDPMAALIESRWKKAEKAEWSRGKEGWGSMRMMEMTEERKQDLMVLNMRATVDPTRHYKHADLKTPKFFQIGTVQEDHYGFYHDRIPNKKRKKTLVDELMADHDFRRKLKKQYQEVQSTKSKGKAVFQTRAPRKIKRKK